MSIQSQLSRVAYNVSDTLSAVNEMGGTLPANATSDDMAAGVRSIPTGAEIDDTTVSTTKTYSSSKIEARFAEIGTQEEIVQQVVAALGTPVFGTVDEENNIILSGNLVSGTYTVKYEDAEGVQTNIGTLTASGNDPTPSYTNVIPLSVDVNGQPYMDGKGYRNGYRYSSSSGGDKSGSAYSVTGYIQVAKNDVLYFKNVGMNKNTTDNNSCQMYYFETLKATADGQNSAANLTAYNAAQWDSEGQITQITADAAGYMRFNTGYLGDDSIITINEPIE